MILYLLINEEKKGVASIQADNTSITPNWREDLVIDVSDYPEEIKQEISNDPGLFIVVNGKVQKG